MDHSHQRFVAHIDILGFSKITESDPDGAWELLSALVDSLDNVTSYELEFLEINQRIPVSDVVKHVTFSDTILLYTRGSTDLDLRSLLVASLALFHQALVRRVPIRVGVAYGLFYFNFEKSMYAGPALIDAYHSGEAPQWLGIALSSSVVEHALRLGMTGGTRPLIVKWDVPHKFETRPTFVLNWPAATAHDLTVIPPLTLNQFYQAFESRFGAFSGLPPEVQSKYENTVKFANYYLMNHPK